VTTQLRGEFSPKCPSVPGSVSFPTDFLLYCVDGGLECWVLSLDGQVRNCRVYRGDSDFLNVTENLGSSQYVCTWCIHGMYVVPVCMVCMWYVCVCV